MHNYHVYNAIMLNDYISLGNSRGVITLHLLITQRKHNIVNVKISFVKCVIIERNDLPQSSCNFHSAIEISNIPARECSPKKARKCGFPFIMRWLTYNEMSNP